MGCIRRSSYDVWTKNRVGHISANHLKVFGEYILAFMQVFLDDFAVYGTRNNHLHHLQLCLERCHTSRLSLNPTKCVFGITSGTLLGHIVSKEDIAVDLGKFDAIIKSPTLKNAKALSCEYSHTM